MNKCEWEDGTFKPCKMGKDAITMTTDTGEASEYHDIIYIGSYNFCPFCGADIRKPIAIKVGMFGKFWDEEGEPTCFEYNTLSEVNNEDTYPYVVAAGYYYRYFTPGLPTGFNMDGTPKEEE